MVGTVLLAKIVHLPAAWL